MDEKDEKLLEKCENIDDSSVMGSCKALLELAAKENVTVEDRPSETYLEMAQTLTPKDVPKVLTLALKIRESGDITDTDLKVAASKLIRAIEMS
ncbi:MAG TPA: hypothetical protein PL055_02065 [Methanobacterium sp.]|jgi:hypothetical protein|nr:MAG: hypothetical protein FGO69_02725 [Methanobacterium sp.]HPX77535.1 hypothetical protein [Methanobacterium sp.]